MEHLCFVKQLSNNEECLLSLNKKPKSLKKLKADLLSKGYDYVSLYSIRKWFDIGNHYTPSQRQITLDIEY